tara:strand:+ start:1151 stop:2149 length:999 start_codon:yes stop_codon:yes gene_type:complete
MTTATCTTNTIETVKNKIKINCQGPLYFALKYIDALIQNVTKTNIPPEIDLMFDIGGFNGLYGQGIGLYISRLEKADYFKVKRVSGASIGSLLALMYLTNIEYNLDKAYSEIKINFQSTCSMKEYQNQVRAFVIKHVDDSQISKLNDKLFITYYDVLKKKQIVVSNYTDQEHLIECIIRSSHFPYISDDTLFYKKQYLDGAHPYIFNDSTRPGLFVTLVTPLTIASTFASDCEKNTHSRVIRGISDANDFFIKGKSTLCSYTNKWGIKDRLLLRSRELFIFTFIFVLNYMYTIKSYIPTYMYDSLCNSLIMQGLIKSAWGLYTDVISNFIIP